MSEQNPVVTRYLDQFRQGLHHLPAAERDDVVQEMASHIAEACAQGQPVAEVLDKLGPADRLARAYAADHLLNRPDGGGPSGWLALLGLLVGTSLPTLILFPLLGGMFLAFTVSGGMSILAGIFTLAFPQFISLPWPVPLPLPQLAVMFIGAVLLGAGHLAFLGLRAYVRFLVAAYRKVSQAA